LLTGSGAPPAAPGLEGSWSNQLHSSCSSSSSKGTAQAQAPKVPAGSTQGVVNGAQKIASGSSVTRLHLSASVGHSCRSEASSGGTSDASSVLSASQQLQQ
jgi:hypothetical protein